MNVRTKRTVIAAAALAAAGLFGSLPFDGSSVAQQGVPSVHRDVALVDVTDTTLLVDEHTLDAALVNDVLGPAGAEEHLYTSLASATNVTNADALLDTTSYSGDFNGAESAGFNGLYLDGLATEDQVNQLAGVSELASQTAILNDLTADLSSIPASSDVTGAELTAALGSSAFDTDLTSIANADYSLAVTDFEGYLTSLSGDTSSLGDFSTLLTDLSASFSDLSSNLSTDFTNVISDVTALLGGAL
jgi:hypothetical protein